MATEQSLETKAQGWVGFQVLERNQSKWKGEHPLPQPYQGIQKSSSLFLAKYAEAQCQTEQMPLRHEGAQREGLLQLEGMVSIQEERGMGKEMGVKSELTANTKGRSGRQK